VDSLGDILMQRYLKTLSDLNGKKEPRLDIIMTLSNHEPFDFPSKNVYLKGR
jgi:hypothetical protein